jgi:hypothetical protein
MLTGGTVRGMPTAGIERGIAAPGNTRGIPAESFWAKAALGAAIRIAATLAKPRIFIVNHSRFSKHRNVRVTAILREYH